MGVRDPWSYPKSLCERKRPGEISRISVWETGGDIRNFCVGVRDPWSYSKFLCGCERIVELSEISVLV